MSTEAGNTDATYLEKGYLNRVDYLEQLAQKFKVSFRTVANLSKLLGKNEDFDKLVRALEDISDDL